MDKQGVEGSESFYEKRNSTSSLSHADLPSSRLLATDPIPAAVVFDRTALPLHLPDLDRHLADRDLFGTPVFSSNEKVCSVEEMDLFGLHTCSYRRDRYDLAGRQLKVRNITGKRSIRRRLAPSCFSRKAGFTKLQDDDPCETSPDVELRAHSPRYMPTSSQHQRRPPTDQVESTEQSHMFAPLMLMTTTSLKVLKSNAVGPRAPPVGWAARLPALNSLVGFIIDTIMGVEGSSFAGSLLRLDLLRDFAQIMRLNLTFQDRSGATNVSKVHKFFFTTLPSILALDFVSVFGLAIVFFILWICITVLGLLWFWRMTSAYDPNRNIQGFEGQPYIFRSPKRGTKAANIIVTFVLTTLYIPLSKLAVDALVWSADFWPTNQGQTSSHPDDSAVWRDAKDYCYTTTMRLDGFNWAWVILPLAAFTVLCYTIAWPLYMGTVILRMRPVFGRYNELGIKRSRQDMRAEYDRQLASDKSPLRFLYNGYRKEHAAYLPIHIIAFKLTGVLIVCLVAQGNCLFHNKDGMSMLVAQQVALIFFQLCLLALHLSTQPFNDAVSNRSELFARVSYVATATVGLLVALRVNGSNIWNSYIMWILQGISYGSSAYFALVTTAFVAHATKRVQNRLDFSLDVFSPRLHLSRHVKRRIWEETLSTILLTAREYRMPLESLVAFSASEKWPPYLLAFQGTPAERHVENLKLLKFMGKTEYQSQIDRMQRDEGSRLAEVLRAIQLRHAGPDAYFRPARPPYPTGVTSFFGKAFVVPFPPMLVMRYDQQQMQSIELTTVRDLELFLSQNDSSEVQDRKRVRLALRALDGQRVQCSYTVTDPSRSSGRLDWRRTPRKQFVMPIAYSMGVLRVKIKESVEWERYNFASGFEVAIHFSQGVRMDAAGPSQIKHKIDVAAAQAFGLHDDFSMSPTTLRFFDDNDTILRARMPTMRSMLRRYRIHFMNEASAKQSVMKYSFLTDIFDGGMDLTQEQVTEAFRASSDSPALQTFPQRFPGTMALLYERLAHLRRSDVHTYWWLWWDDCYRQNAADYPKMSRWPGPDETCFDPRQPTSIAYRPMPRADLERFLLIRGLWQEEGGRGPFHRGLLNRLYFTLNAITVGQRRLSPDVGHIRSIYVGQGAQASIFRARRASSLDGDHHNHKEEDEEEEHLSRDIGRTSESADTRHLAQRSLDTGGGTSENRSTIRDRRAWAWEQRMDGQPAMQEKWKQRLWDTVLEKLALRPYRIDPGLKPLWIFLRKDEDGQRWVLPAHGEEGYVCAAVSGRPF